MTDEEPTANEQFIFDQIKERYDFEHSRHHNLDTKAGTLVGWIGLVISVMLAGGGLLFSNPDDQLNISADELKILQATLTVMILSLIAGLVAFRVGSYSVVPEARPLIKFYANETKRVTLKRMGATMIDAIESNKRVNDRKANIIAISWGLFMLSMVLAAIFIIMQAVKLLN